MTNDKNCPRSKEILGKHELMQSGQYIICSRKCGYKKKGVLKTTEVMPSLKRTDLAFGRNPGTLKGGQWGNKADKEVSAHLHRENPPPRSTGEASAAASTCLISLFMIPFVLPIALTRALFRGRRDYANGVSQRPSA